MNFDSLFGMIVLIIMTVLNATLSPGSTAPDFTGADAAAVREHIGPLGDCGSNDGQYPAIVKKYFRYYGLDFESEDVKHLFGSFQSGDFRLAAHIYLPERPVATVVLLHGFGDHVGILSPLAEYLLKRGYAVAAYDMPGFGLSDGQRACIDDFGQYSTALRDFVGLLDRYAVKPYHIIAHSTGGAAVIDYCLSAERKPVFDKVILAAPLIRSSAWTISKLGCRLGNVFVDYVPRVFRKNSSDENFLRFVKYSDPLQPKRISLKWTGAMYDWNSKIQSAEVSTAKVFVIQGTGDTTVSWKYNIDFIRRKFPSSDVYLAEKAGHELFNESPDLQKEVFEQIADKLKEF